jgi:uncharacterized protein (DUF433 family)
MSFVVPAEPMPLFTDADGVVRISGTRVTLDTIVAAYREGATAETIAEQYPSLSLANVYTALGYYLRHQAEVDANLQKRQHQAAQVRQENETRFAPLGVRERLLARRHSQG